MSNLEYKKSKQKNPHRHTTKTHEDQSLKGTFVSVMLLGTFIVVAWVGIFYLFISRL